MKKTILTVTENVPLTENVCKMILWGDSESVPGRFINIALEGLYLRRPISVCDSDDETITVIYKVVGQGTAKLKEKKPGDRLDVLTGLGNGYEIDLPITEPVVIGGGVGVPPMYMLTKKLLNNGEKPTVILGFNTEKEIFYREEFEALGVKTIVTTVDGSYGIKGFVTDAMKETFYDYFFACGPEPMLKAVYRESKTSGQMSFEERMGCGFGACMGCSCKTVTGYKRICKDGPVLRKEEILW